MILFLPLKIPRWFYLFGVFILLLPFLLFFYFADLNRSCPASALLPLSHMVIGVDPGHGGYDPGVVISEDGIIEKDIVLGIGLCLEEYLQQGGAKVVMTRKTDADLLELPAAGPKKRKDMDNRLAILENSRVDLLVSVHANSFPAANWRGAQTFYQNGKENGEILAGCLQSELTRVLQNTDRLPQAGDFFLLRELGAPGAIVEVGFLSNREEATLLLDSDYQKKIAWAIYAGIIRYANHEG
ncbi:MAG TPA: hypothetical protein GXZ24_01050 [Firmicutes bacterium]|jgi:N-acetylmuramoyl-L-alanine amidase|nr:hypothetical protein [Bacillota bacterium]